LGAPIENGFLCTECVLAATVALRHLPDDIKDLRRLLVSPALRQNLRDPDMPSQPRVKKASPLPFREEVYTLMELIDYETTIWGESVADAADEEWDSYAVEHSRQHARVERACTFLGTRLAGLVQLPVQQHRAHSLTDNPADGHDVDSTTRYRGDYWANRPGWEALVRFIELHDRATRYINPTDHNRVPCPRCHEQRLEREHHNDHVVCRGCEFRMTDDDYDVFLAHALEAHPSPGAVITRSEAARLAGVKPITIKKWVQRGYIRPLPAGGYRRQAIVDFLASRDTPEAEYE
jgi:hypothetical protein